MEMWELAKRILASANTGRSFTPSLEGGNYRSDLEVSGETKLPPVEDFHNWADLLASNMRVAELIESVPSTPGRLALLNVVRRTSFGDELYEALQRREVISALRAMQIKIEAGEIRRALDQLRS